MRAAIFGNLRNTLGSTSIAVETGRPVLGHLIITELMAEPSDTARPTARGMEPANRDRLKTAGPLVDKVSCERNGPRNQSRGAELTAREFQSGGSPLTPRIAVWRKDPRLRLGVFFLCDEPVR